MGVAGERVRFGSFGPQSSMTGRRVMQAAVALVVVGRLRPLVGGRVLVLDLDIAAMLLAVTEADLPWCVDEPQCFD